MADETMDEKVARFRDAFSELMGEFGIEHATMCLGFAVEGHPDRYAQGSMLVHNAGKIAPKEVMYRHAEGVKALMATLVDAGAIQVDPEFYNVMMHGPHVGQA